MVTEKRQSRVTRSTRVKQASSQKTLYDLFQKETILSEECRKEGDGAEPEVSPQVIDIIVIDDDPSPPRPEAPRPVIRGSTKTSRSQPANLFPIFGRPLTTPILPPTSSSPNGSTGNTELLDQPQSSYESSNLQVPDPLQLCSIPCVNDMDASKPTLTQTTRQVYTPGEVYSLVERHVHAGDTSLDAPFPIQKMQHVRGPQSVFTASLEPPKRYKHSLLDSADDPSLAFLSSLQANGGRYPQLECLTFPRTSFQSQCDDYLGVHGPRDAALYPAIHKYWRDGDFAYSTNCEPIQQEVWTTRFRPRQANEVLGNEYRALYIRDWLKALEVRLHTADLVAAKTGRGKQKNMPHPPERPLKRPRVVRAVNKPKGRKKRRIDSEDELDEFIAFSDDEDIIIDNPEENIDGEDFEFCQRMFSRLQQKSNSRQFEQHPRASEINVDAIQTNQHHRSPDPDFSENLTNTLLITGPPGCGKSAAVYACAEELGWEVFEVYPGIGKRSGANLDNLVGDVGKNHLVQQARPNRWKAATQCDSRTSVASSTLFRKGGNVNPKPSLPSDTEHPIDVDTHILVDAASKSLKDTVEPPGAIDGRGDSLKKDGSMETSTTTRQSLIFLEEVDILFKEDAGFWPSVVELIKECRRPVIMTCNDIQLVPVADLPLQTVLRFQPCPSGPAVTFLQCLCLAEGCAVPRERLTQLYGATNAMQSMDLPDSPLNPRTDPLPLPDLRRSITQLQLICTDAIHGAMVPRETHNTTEYGLSLPLTISAQTSANGSTTEELWRRISNYADFVSYTDSFLCRTPPESCEALSHNLSEPSFDDETGHAILFRPSHVSDTRDALAFYHNDEVIAQEAIHLARDKHEDLGTIPIITSINPAASSSSDIGTSLFQARMAYQTQMLTALQDIIQPPAPLMPQSSVYLDYIPWVRTMVAVDDSLERLAWEGMEKARSGRLTRNSMKAKHIRNIDLREDQYRAFVATRMQGLEEG